MDAKELKLYQAPETIVVNIESQCLLTASGNTEDIDVVPGSWT